MNEKKQQPPRVEQYDGFPDDEQVLDVIWRDLRRRGIKADPLPGSPAWNERRKNKQQQRRHTDGNVH